MIICSAIKKFLRPLWRKAYQTYEKKHVQYSTFDVPINKLLRGGENGIRAAKYAELSGNFMRPSTPIIHGHHIKLLQLFDQIGEKIFEEGTLKETDYYKNALQCIHLTGSYFYDDPEMIQTLARRFINQHIGLKEILPAQPGQSEIGQPIWVRPIRDSSYYEVIDGNHRIALAYMKGETSIRARIYDKEPTYTPLQQLLLDSLWINKKKWLYQPVDSPELNENWKLVRKSKDRLILMKNFLKNIEGLKSYLDIGSCYGWFLSQMKKEGFDVFGMDRDPFAVDIGQHVYDLDKSHVMLGDIGASLKQCVDEKKSFDIVSCFSVLHHYALGKSSLSAQDFMQLIDKVTGKVLFFETGQDHESAFEGSLNGWNDDSIPKWIQQNSTFKKVIFLGKDKDNIPPFEGYYQRALYACTRD